MLGSAEQLKLLLPLVPKLKHSVVRTAGRDFDNATHRLWFLQRLEPECPDEVLLTPTCGPWSTMQNLNARDPQQQAKLLECPEWHHGTHLAFDQKVYETQIKNGGHAHIQQPAPALSWKARALSFLPGFRCTFDQCAYGCRCLDQDGLWKPVRKATTFLTTKMALYQQFQLRCDGSHKHCHLEGHAKGFGLRTKYLEKYQPAFATVLAAALLSLEAPMIMDFAGAVADDRQHSGELIKLLSENRRDAVRTVQRLHRRNHGHPSTSKLVELLEARGASQTVIDVAKNY